VPMESRARSAKANPIAIFLPMERFIPLRLARRAIF
jgi:hypothetical protein